MFPVNFFAFKKQVLTFACMKGTGIKQESRDKVYTLTEKQLFDFGEHITVETVKKMMSETHVSRAQAAASST